MINNLYIDLNVDLRFSRKDLIILLVDSPVQFLEGSGGTAKAIANPWPELDFQREPYMSVPDSIYPLLSLLLHHADCGAAVAVG